MRSLLNYFRYPGRESHWAFLLRRLTGLGVVGFLMIHVLDTATVYFFPAFYLHALALYRSTLFMLGEILLVGAVIFHGVNGLQIVLKDAFPHWWAKETERASFWRVVGLGLAGWLPAAFWMGRSLYLNNICRCAPEPARPVGLAWPLLGVVAVAVVSLVVLIWGYRLRAAPVATRLVALPRRGLEAWGWLFMRWSGVLLLPLAGGHLLIQDVLVGVHAIDLDYVALRWSQWAWRAYDAGLLAFGLAHGFNGLRGILVEYFPRRQRLIHWGLLVGWLIIVSLGATALLGGVKN